jgi:hypothetical protein
LWDTDNISGLEKKLSRLTGIQNFFRRFLHCLGNASVISTADTPPKFQFVITNQNGDTLTSSTFYDTEDAVNGALPVFIELVLEETNFEITQAGSEWQIVITDSGGNTIAASNNFPSVEAAQTAVDLFIAELKITCDSEGLHLIEHILLRPRSNQFALAPVCLDLDCDFCGEQDPYSFRISIVLPYWTTHFRNLSFRNYFEDIVRQESPAHTTVKVCWIANGSLYEFENAYKNWITALANYSFDQPTINVFQAANDKLLNLLFNLHSVYPAASLHDCDESKIINPVMLGKTILGSFKN